VRNAGIRRGKAGVAALELALVAPVFTTLLVGVADFSMAYHQQLQLAAAVSAGALYAFAQGQTESGTTLTTDVKNFVTAVSAVSLTSVTVKYNNGLVATSCYCVHASPPTYSAAMTCGATCTDGSGSTAGKFVSISAKITYTAKFPPDQAFFPNPFTRRVTVRLQ
jgi:Flp pilus assembly protein TadG